MQKHTGNFIICSECGKKIFYEEKDEQENIEECKGDIRVYWCECGAQIVLPS